MTAWPMVLINSILIELKLSTESCDGVVLYHFNGLESAGKSPRFCKFLVYLRSVAHTIGQQISLDESYSGSTGMFGCPCEDVLRTRWPGCKVDWIGEPPPSLD